MEPTSRRRGRPRSEPTRQAILQAVAHLLEEGGYGGLTMEAIARRAGVSKQTVYRWWPGRSAVVQEALGEGAAAIAPDPDTGSLESDLTAFVRDTARAMSGNRVMLTGLMAEAQLDEEAAATFRTGFLDRRREVLRTLIERGRDRGEVCTDAEVELLIDMVFGVLWYRLLRGRGTDGDDSADLLSAAVLKLCSH